MTERMRYVLALVVGLLAIPGLAFATNSALTDDGSEAATEVLGTDATTTTVVDATAISAEDLVRACGVEGHYLVDLEAAGAIDEVQQAALNALRPICEESGLPLPAAPAVDGGTIVETVTVVRSASGPAAAGSAKTTTTTAAAAAATTAEDQSDEAAKAFAARELALAAVDAAIEVGGKVDKINEAIGLVESGDAAYEAGDYGAAEHRYEEAESKALEAQQELEDHDDYEDHDDEDHDDEDEDEDHEDEEDEEDED